MRDLILVLSLGLAWTLTGCGDDAQPHPMDGGDDAGNPVDGGSDASDGEPEPDGSVDDDGMDASMDETPVDAGADGSTTSQDSGAAPDATYTYDAGGLPEGVTTTAFCGDYATICGYVGDGHFATPGDCQNSFQDFSDNQKGCVIHHLEMAEQDDPSQDSEHCVSAAGGAPCN